MDTIPSDFTEVNDFMNGIADTGYDDFDHMNASEIDSNFPDTNI